MDEKRQEFLSAILHEPNVDELRLVYADWLEEQGDPRGEFIRIQCELESIPWYEHRAFDLWRRNADLLKRYGKKWAREVRRVDEYEFQRGFIQNVTIKARSFARAAQQVYEQAPIQWLKLDELDGMGAKLAKSPSLQLITHLNFYQADTSDEDLNAVIASPNLSKLRHLDLRSCRLPSDFDMTAHADRLESLIISGDQREQLRPFNLAFPRLKHFECGFHLDTVELGALPDFQAPSLESLSLSGKIRPTLQALDMSWEKLRTLKLFGADPRSSDIKFLSDRGGLRNLQEFEITLDAKLADVQSLFADDNLSECQCFRLETTKIKPVSATQLQQGLQQLQNLRTLELFNVPLGNGELFQSQNLAGLEALCIFWRQLEPKAVESLRKAAFREHLRSLHFLNSLNKTAIDELCKAVFPSVTSLSFHRCHMGDDEFAKLVKAGTFPSLRELTLYDCGLSAKSLRLIASDSCFDSLNNLRFQVNRASKSSLMKLLERPQLDLVHLYGTSGIRQTHDLEAEYGERIQF